ncbi:MAG: GNAT family N-acetyltransferase [Trueperaceae bacterium]|nr:GNAT family N-acetyltransferase [Trueperaceae bacterium]
MSVASTRIRELPSGQRPLPLHEALDVFRKPADQAEALADIARDPRGHVFVAERDDHTVGYATFHPPGRDETWGRLPSENIVEIGAVEIAPYLRGEHLAERLLQQAFGDGRFDDAVVFATMYAWHYDLARTGLTPFAYKRLLEKLYRKVGLVPLPTADPEVRMDAANALMARVGPNADPDAVRTFHALRTRPPPAGY